MGATVSNLFHLYCPPSPKFTEANLPDLSDKVYLVTGATGGVGYELARMLYSRNARVWVAARSPDKGVAAFAEIKQACPGSRGQLRFLRLDLTDLTTIKPAVAEFLANERKLHVLWNNAAVMTAQLDQDGKIPRTSQGYEMQLGVNCVGPFLLTKLLTPLLAQTAKIEDPGTARVVWVASCGAYLLSPHSTGVSLDHLDYKPGDPFVLPVARYGVSKAGNYLHAVEYARRHCDDGIISVALNPGNLDSDLWRDLWAPVYWFIRHVVLYPKIYGAYTELFAGLSPDVTMARSGDWIEPWGRFAPMKKSLETAGRTEQDGGGTATRFWDWSEEQVTQYC